MQSFSRYQTINLTHAIELPSNDIINIQNALTINGVFSIICLVLQINASIQIDNETSRSGTFIVIADESGTSILLVYDLNPNLLKIKSTYKFTNIKSISMNGSKILAVTINTRMEPSTVV